MRKSILTCMLITMSSGMVLAQTSADTASRVKKQGQRASKAPFAENTILKSYGPNADHQPQTAVMRSLLIPGWGQCYNHDFWKVPVIYTGLGLLASSVISNGKNYARFLALAKIARTGTVPQGSSDPNYRSYQKYKADYQLYVVQNNYSSATLAGIASNAQRNVQVSILGLAGVWGVNIIDAYIQAKFIHSYSIDNNLSIKITPCLAEPLYSANYNATSYSQRLKIIFSYK